MAVATRHWTGLMTALPDVAAASGAAARRRGISVGSRGAVLASVLVITALISEREDWQPISLVVALGLVMVLADAAAVSARRVRISAGLMVQVTIMALLGPAPAVAIGLLGTLVDSRVNRVEREYTLHNLFMFGILGLVGGVLFDLLRAGYGLDRHDTAYAAVVLPVYLVLVGINLALVTTHRALGTRRLRIFRETVLPALPLGWRTGCSPPPPCSCGRRRASQPPPGCCSCS